VRRARVGEAHLLEREPAADEPASEAVDQAQQPFEGEHAAWVGGGGAQRPQLGDFELGEGASAFDRHLQVGKDDAQEARGPVQRLFEGATTHQRAAEELERARAQRLREERESLVVEVAHDGVVERGVVFQRNTTGEIGALDAGIAQHRLGGHAGRAQPREHAGDEAARDGRPVAGWGSHLLHVADFTRSASFPAMAALCEKAYPRKLGSMARQGGFCNTRRRRR
jgi:hypothetical protein